MDGGTIESVLEGNLTLTQMMNVLNLTGANVTSNDSAVFNLYEAWRSREKEQLIMYKWVAYVLGALIVISNLTVVISSGLILRKGQQHKSTYLLLGNVSLADTIIGISIIFGASVDRTLPSNQLCIFQLGMLVCPAIVSIFSVGFIAVDRYIYILHGLYYQRWFNTTRVRIGILCIWMIGVTLGFAPATGWVNNELYSTSTRCNYVAVFPGALILFNSLLSILPIMLVFILYIIILIHALRNLKTIKRTEKSVRANSSDLESFDKPKLRINRGNTKSANNTQGIKSPDKDNVELKRSASFTINDTKTHSSLERTEFSSISKSIDDINTGTINSSPNSANNVKTNTESNFSIYTIESSYSNDNSMVDITETPSKDNKRVGIVKPRTKKVKGPNKWRAITVVMLTSFSFIITWMPFFIIVSIFVFCEEKLTNPKCFHLRVLLTGPLAILAFLNSVFNPLIYAWWHKGFQKSIKQYFKNYFQKYFFNR